MKPLPLLATTLLALAVPSVAAAKPSMPKTYSGSVVGTQVLTSKNDSTTLTDKWTIANIKLRRGPVKSVRGGWRAYYKVIGGSVSWSQVKTGACQHTVTDSFPLKSALPRVQASAPFGFELYGGHWQTFGLIDTDKVVSAKDVCTYPGEEPREDQIDVAVPTLFSVGLPAVKRRPTRKLNFTARDNYEFSDSNSKKTWKVSLTGR